MPFKKGQSGNPAGRKPGKTPAIELKQSIVDNMPEILAALINSAKEGDTAAGKALMDKVIPGLKTHAQGISIVSGDGLIDQSEAVINSVFKGDTPPDTGATLITALASQARLVEVAELNKRMERIEKLLEAKK